MAKTAAAFYELPPWIERMNQLQQQINRTLCPLLKLQADHAALAGAMAAASDTAALHGFHEVSRILNDPSMAAICRAQEIAAKTGTFGMAAALRQYQAVMDSVVPTALQTQVSERLQEWSRVLSKAADPLESLTEAKSAELTRLSSLTEAYTAADMAEDPVVLSKDEQRMVADEVEEILLSGKNWEQRFADQIEKFSQTHPVIAWVLEKIFFAILISVAASIVSSALGQALFPANVYEDPRASAPVIYHIEPSQSVMIIGEAPYYYEVMVNDPSSDICHTGYVSKRSIRLTENEDHTAEVHVK